MFVCKSNNNYYDIYPVLYFLQIFNHFNILYFNCIIAHLCYNYPLMYFTLLNASLKMAKKGWNM
jgi:hypothetical protein